MSDYDFRPGGSLKLKGVIEGGVTKKKKKKDKSKLKLEKAVDERSKTRSASPADVGKEEGSLAKDDRKSPSGASSESGKTEAERRFEEIQKRRMAERVKKLAAQSHKDRVHSFNAKLESLSEHHDIPKVGPG